MTGPGARTPSRAVLIPPALARFICGFAGSNLIVVINDISADLHTLGPAVAGTILTSGPTGHAYATTAIITLAALGSAGLGIAAFLPPPPATPRAL